MPLQNRVGPDGTIFADSARGTLMGNRGGQLHDAQRRLTGRRWVSKAWIACVLEYRDRHESIMAPGHYTQLFFLDEATALAAGHRPCALCRHADFVRFMTLWQELHGFPKRPKVAKVDRVLHEQRLDAGRLKRTFASPLGEMPSGTMVVHESGPLLSWGNALYPWTPSGYLAPTHLPAESIVQVLTPPSVVAMFSAGYAPLLHDSARSISATKS